MGVSIEAYRISIGNFNSIKYNKIKMKCRQVHRQYYTFKIILLITLLFSSIYTQSSTHDRYSQRNRNKFAHSTYRNSKFNSINILHWNKGCSHFHNKINDILTIIDRYRPNIMSLSEANYSLNSNKLGQDFMGPLQVWPMVCGCRGSKNVTYRQQTTDKKLNTEPL